MEVNFTLARRPDHPERQPEQRAETEDEEQRSPAILSHNQPAHQRPQGRPQLRARVNQRVGHTALALFIIAGNDFREGRVSDGLAEAQQQSKAHQTIEATDKARRRRGQRPDEEADAENQMYFEAVN